ncbi:MAG: Fe-S cluster assembly protein HesB [Planctomycetota bacterium]
MIAKRTWRLRAVGPYDLRTTVHGHGWVDLSPHAWSEDDQRLDTAIALDDERAADVRIVPSAEGATAQIAVDGPFDDAAAARLRVGLRRMLRLDVDLEPFWAECRRHERLAWVPRMRAGHLMQSPRLFDDLLRLLFTTNCSWAATRLMCSRTVDALGPIAPSGRRAFPSAARCAREPESFWRETVRAGYRAKSCRLLAESFAGGALDDAHFEDPTLSHDVLEKRFLALPGFGPYATGHAMRGLLHFENLALDSWCRARMTTILGRNKPPSDRWFEREYARFGRFRGLALWMELTADWHGVSR